MCAHVPSVRAWACPLAPTGPIRVPPASLGATADLNLLAPTSARARKVQVADADQSLVLLMPKKMSGPIFSPDTGSLTVVRSRVKRNPGFVGAAREALFVIAARARIMPRTR